MLQTKNLHVSVEEKEILQNINLSIKPGELHVILGPNGSGKSTLANSLMGHPSYNVTDGKIEIDGIDITHEQVNKRAKAGLFLSLQNTPEIQGVTVSNFLRTVISSKTGEKLHPVKFYKTLQEKMKELQINPEFAKRYINVGFSGGEKKRLEILQLLLLNPKYAILDETDSGLDVDAQKIVAEGITTFHGAGNAVLLITHHHKLLDYLNPDMVHIMKEGKIMKTGTAELAKTILQQGFSNLTI